MMNTGTPLSPWSRDQPMRAVMRWDNSTNGGFCDKCNQPWADVGDASKDEIQVGIGKSTCSVPSSNVIRNLVWISDLHCAHARGKQLAVLL